MQDHSHKVDQIPVRRMTYFSGNVQGVGFRATTSQIAAEFEVTGYVKNLPDGRVEVVAEGMPEEINLFILRVEQSLSTYIDDVTSMDSTARGDIQSFHIAY